MATFKRIKPPDEPVEQACGAMDANEDHESGCASCEDVRIQEILSEEYAAYQREEHERAVWHAMYGSEEASY
jgi:hypothetical protein